MSEFLKKIQGRGYWHVVIRPGTFVEKRVQNISHLIPILEKTRVSLRGWDFPHVDDRTDLLIGLDYVERSFEWERFLEVLRFYQSGQFVHISGVTEDWISQSSWANPPEDWKPGKVLNVVDTVFHFTEIFEFAARLAMTEAGDEQMHIEIKLGNLQGRKLWINSEKRMGFRWDKKASIPEFPYSLDIPRTKLLSQPKDLALTPAIELFRRFNWEPDVENLRSMQAELR
jgi:hypothetical protein